MDRSRSDVTFVLLPEKLQESRGLSVGAVLQPMIHSVKFRLTFLH